MPVPTTDPMDLDALARNVDRYCSSALLEKIEKLEAVKTVVEAHAGRRFVIAGIDALSPTDAVRLANLYAEVGTDMVRVRVPPISKNPEAPI